MKKLSKPDSTPKRAAEPASSGTFVAEAELAPPTETWDDILLARAHALAQPKEELAPAEVIELVTFQLAHETYGFEISHVREVYPLRNLTPLPGTPPYVAGVINVRGQVLSVIDIKKFFDLPERGLTDLNKVIILSDDTMAFGILADAIGDVRKVTLEELQCSLPTLTGIREEYLKGITADRLVVLDAASLLADSTIVLHEDV